MLAVSAPLAGELPAGAVAVTPSQLTWKPNPRVAGLEVADVVGDAQQPGPYIQRVRFPPNFQVQAHSHPDDRAYTIISGTWYIGWGEKLDPGTLQALPAGSFYTEPAGVRHFVATRAEPAVIQIQGMGPTATQFVDPAHAAKKP
jgi:quercetin dioxygenase-like cupin family protein